MGRETRGLEEPQEDEDDEIIGDSAFARLVTMI